MNKPVKIVFTVSLILNVLFLGLAAGEVFFDDDHHRGHRPWDEAKAALAPDTRDIMKATFKEKKKDIIPLFKDARQKKEAMKVILSASEFDGEAYDELAAELGALKGKFMEHRFAAIKTIFSQLPQEERAKIAGHTVEKMLGKPPHGRKIRIHHRETIRSSHSGVNESQRIHKRGAIEAAPGKRSFDAREVIEDDGNHYE